MTFGTPLGPLPANFRSTDDAGLGGRDQNGVWLLAMFSSLASGETREAYNFLTCGIFAFTLPVAHLREGGYKVRTVKELLRHRDVQTTMVYTQILNRGGRAVQSPLDRLRRAPSSENGRITRADRNQFCPVQPEQELIQYWYLEVVYESL